MRRCFDKSKFSIGYKWILKYWFDQKILRINANVRFPVPRNVTFGNPNNIEFEVNDMFELQSNGSILNVMVLRLY